MKGDKEHMKIFKSCLLIKFICQTLIIEWRVWAIVSMMHYCISAWDMSLSRQHVWWCILTNNPCVSKRSVKLGFLWSVLSLSKVPLNDSCVWFICRCMASFEPLVLTFGKLIRNYQWIRCLCFKVFRNLWRIYIFIILTFIGLWKDEPNGGLMSIDNTFRSVFRVRTW